MTHADATGDARPPRLLDQVRAKRRLLHDAIRTEEAYVNWIRRFIHFYHKKIRARRDRARSPHSASG
jgi:Phage integrase, N-terminal SAM-like domain